MNAQVNPAAGQRWRPRVDQLHSFWSQNLFSRDADITPVGDGLKWIQRSVVVAAQRL